MNILVPDTWLREYLQTDATPKELKQYVSLCGQSIERVNTVDGETVYDIEVTGNRPDAMSVVGIAREASVILPRFDIDATLLFDPYTTSYKTDKTKKEGLELRVSTNETLNPRFMTVVFDHVTIKPSPSWLAKRLEQVGIRSINNVIDITNYIMHAYGQPAHVFDYDKIIDHTMTLREAKKGEEITTLDGKTYTLPGGDIVIVDGSDNLIDLCGIMGGARAAIGSQTKRVVLFVQTYDPTHIRKTSMSLAKRTEASGLFEKNLDTELVAPVLHEGMKLMHELTGGVVASEITDIYKHPYIPKTITTSRTKIDHYIGTHLDDEEINDILTALGFSVIVTEEEVVVTPPSYRRDVEGDVDVIEELSRIYGYHTIQGKLPETEPPMVFEDPILQLEQTIKTKLSNWGYTETYTYSMISEELMNIFSIDKETTYTITNPLSSDWVYMRPTLLPSMLLAIQQNLSYASDLKLFELSMTYAWQKNDLPDEQSTLIVAVSGARYAKIKGIAENIFASLGIPMPDMVQSANAYYKKDRSLRLGNFGQLGEIETTLLAKMGLSKPVTVLELSILQLLKHKKLHKQYIPVPKNPASFEDLAFVVPDKSPVAPMIESIKKIHPLVKDVSLFDSFKNVRTFHITYQSDTKNITKEDTAVVREKIISHMKTTFHATLKA